MDLFIGIKTAETKKEVHVKFNPWCLKSHIAKTMDRVIFIRTIHHTHVQYVQCGHFINRQLTLSSYSTLSKEEDNKEEDKETFSYETTQDALTIDMF